MPKDLDPRTVALLQGEGVRPSTLKPYTGPTPYTTAGLHALKTYNTPELVGTNTRGFVLGSNAFADFDKNRAQSNSVFLRPGAGQDTVAHEAEHLMATKGLGTASAINRKFDELIGDTQSRRQFVSAAIDAAPYLKEKYGIENAYFAPEMLRRNPGGVLMYEQLASLAGYEAANNVDLTKDPELRKTLFKDKNVRETYNAITGLRQTRTDAKDLPSYTRQPEKPEKSEPGMVDKVKKLLGFANGGRVDTAGNKKLI